MTDATDTAEWEVFLVNTDSFTERDDEKALALLRLFPDEDAIDREYGDCFPDTIAIARDTAKPQPQSPGSEFLRMPGSWRTSDLIEFDLNDVDDSEHAMILWHAAKGAAERLNQIEEQTA